MTFFSIFGNNARSRAFAPPKPITTHPSTTANGVFTITNYNSLYTYIFTPSVGTATLSNITLTTADLTLSNTNSTCIITPTFGGLSPIASTTVERKSATQQAYYQWYNPCGDCNTSVNPNTWSCGCVGGDSGGGAWGVCICRKSPGPVDNYTGSGYTWSGADYTNMSGEWYKIN